MRDIHECRSLRLKFFGKNEISCFSVIGILFVVILFVRFPFLMFAETGKFLYNVRVFLDLLQLSLWQLFVTLAVTFLNFFFISILVFSKQRIRPFPLPRFSFRKCRL